MKQKKVSTGEQPSDVELRVSCLQEILGDILNIADKGTAQKSSEIKKLAQKALEICTPPKDNEEHMPAPVNAPVVPVNTPVRTAKASGSPKRKTSASSKKSTAFRRSSGSQDSESSDAYGSGRARRHQAKFARTKPLMVKIPIPTEPAGVNYIGRILGPRGISVRELEGKTNCKIVIQGRGSVRDPAEEERLRGLPGYEHLKEELHIRVTAICDGDVTDARERLGMAQELLERLLVVKNDLYKQRQLVQYALMTGTYRPNHSILKVK
uniref:KH domain-containing protein n=1 Tax=Steinernema glaseri TaxID=37863 RepID=A0A1I7YNZ0_9BILA